MIRDLSGQVNASKAVYLDILDDAAATITGGVRSNWVSVDFPNGTLALPRGLANNLPIEGLLGTGFDFKHGLKKGFVEANAGGTPRGLAG